MHSLDPNTVLRPWRDTRIPARGLEFDTPVPNGGYAWWYIDAFSDDGAYALTVIVFVGSVFSPTYFAARQLDPATPAASVCAVNAVLYRRGRRAWVLTEPRPHTVQRSPDRFALSGSVVERDPTGLRVQLDERCAPWGGRLRGTVRLDIRDGLARPRPLDRAGLHHWWPVGARARAEVELDSPDLRFSGSGYHDCNFGDGPLEETFSSWDWSRAESEDDVCITYDVVEREGPPTPLALRIRNGEAHPWHAEHPTSLRRGLWGVGGNTRASGPTQRIRLLEDTPFYTRSLLRMPVDGRQVFAMHESLDLTRFVRPWVQRLLPFRIRRGWRA